MIDALWLALRAAGFLVLLSSCGGVLFLALCRAELTEAAALALRAKLRRTALAALAITLAQGLIEPAHLAGAWEGLAERPLWRLAFASPAANSWWLRMAGLTALAAGLAQPGRAGRALALTGALLALASLLLTGHTVTAAPRMLLSALLTLHVLVAAFWFGSVRSLRALLGQLPLPHLVRVLRRFSACAVWLVPLLGLAGLTLAILLLPGLEALGRPYGLCVCLKALLFASLLGLAAFNRALLTPALARGESPACIALARTLAAEAFLIGAVLIVTAVMTGQFSPHD